VIYGYKIYFSPTSILSTENQFKVLVSLVTKHTRNNLIQGKKNKTIKCSYLSTHTKKKNPKAEPLTCVEVSVAERLQNAVHGAHVEQEAELSDGHGHQAEQEDGADDGF